MTDAVIGALRVTLGLDTAQFEKGLRHAQDKLGSVNLGKGILEGVKTLERGLEETAARLGGFGASLSAIGGVGLAAAAALGGVAEALNKTREAIEVAAEFGKLAKTVGVSTDFIQKFNFAARQSDIDVAAADESLKGLNTSLGLVQSGLARSLTTKAFAAIGFTPEQLRQFHDVGDFFPVLVERMAKLGNAAEQAAIAKRLGIAELLPLLRDGAANFNKLAQEAADLGIVLDASLIQKSEEAKKKLLELDDVAKARANVTFAQFAGTLIAVKNAFLEAKVAGLDFLGIFTGTLSPEREVEKIKGQLTALQRLSTAFSPAQQSLFDHLNLRLSTIQRQQASAAPAEAPFNAPAKDLVPKAAKQTQDDQALEAAVKAELAARIALTGDIVAQADLRLQEIEDERAAANRKLADERASGKIAAATATRAQILNDTAAAEKKTQVLRQRDADLAQQAVQREGELNGYAQRIASAQAQFAGSAAARAKLEETALGAQQKVERDQLKANLDALVIAGKLTQAQEDRLRSALTQAQTAEALRKLRDDEVAIAREQLDHAKSALEDQARVLGSEAILLKSTTARADVEARLLKIKQQLEEMDLQGLIAEDKILGASQAELDLLQARLESLRQAHANEQKIVQAEGGLYRRMTEAADAVSGLKDAIGRRDWGGVFDQMQRAIETITAAFQSKGLTGGLAATGATLATLVGGKTGNALGTGLTAGVLASGAASAIGGIGAVLGGMFVEGGLGSALVGIGAFLGPLAPIIGIVAALATLLGNSKPSNFTASAAFQGTAGATFGGDKPNDATSKLVQQAAGSVLTAEQTLAAAGVKLTTTVANLEIGQRDPSKITLSNGQVLHSAVGDTAAAVDTALKAVLRGAQFTDAAEQKLVTSLLDAGKGFDDVVAGLNNYQAAQAALQGVTDQILQLTNPQASDLKKVAEGVKAQRAAAQAAADAGYLTADQLAQVNAQLDQLQKLQLDQVLAKYGDAVQQATAAQAAANQAVQAAQQAVSDARDREAASIQATIDKYQAFATSLAGYLQNLDASTAVPATANLAGLAAQFAAASTGAQLGDPAAFAALQGAADKFRVAGEAQAHTAAEARAIDDKIRAGVTAAADTAKRQVTVGQQQLDQLNATVDQLLQVNQNLVGVQQAIANLATAQAAAASVYQAAFAAAQTAEAAAIAAATIVPPASAAAGPDLNAGAPPIAPDAAAAAAAALQAGPTGGDPLSAAVEAALAPFLLQIVKNTGNLSDNSDQWTAIGLPTFAAV